jgi:hypothetical protein
MGCGLLMVTIETLIELWEKTEQYANHHKQGARYIKELVDAWAERPDIAEMYEQLHAVHQKEHEQFLAQATILREQLDDKLMRTLPDGAELFQPYIDYVDGGGVFTYPQYIDAVKELEQEVSTPIDTSEDSTPF